MYWGLFLRMSALFVTFLCTMFHLTEYKSTVAACWLVGSLVCPGPLGIGRWEDVEAAEAVSVAAGAGAWAGATALTPEESVNSTDTAAVIDRTSSVSCCELCINSGLDKSYLIIRPISYSGSKWHAQWRISILTRFFLSRLRGKKRIFRVIIHWDEFVVQH